MGVLAVLAAGLSLSGQNKPDAPKPGGDPNTPSAVPKTPEGVGVGVDPNKYVLGAEDLLFIRTWRENDFTLPAAIRPDGKITMPLVGEVQAAGLTPMQLTAELKEKLGKYINNPDVMVMVTDVRSKRYFIDGEVNRSGPFPLVTPTTVFEALSMANGFKEFARPNRIKILRGDKSFKFNYKEYVSGKHREQNILLENGDHIIVP